jgi:hypothetical protein
MIRRFIVRTTRCAIVAAIFSAVFIAGCGEEEPKPVDVSKVPQPAEGKAMLGEQMKNVKMKGQPSAKTAE